MSILTAAVAAYVLCPIHGYEVDIGSLKQSIRPDPVVSEFFERTGRMRNMPLVYSGYRHVEPFRPQLKPLPFEMDAREYDADSLRYVGILQRETIPADELEEGDEVLELPSEGPRQDSRELERRQKENLKRMGELPQWLRTALSAARMQRDLRYNYMISHPWKIAYAAWDVPLPPTLPDEDYSYEAFLESLDLPEIDAAEALIPEFEVKKRHWLHQVGTGLQFSQAFVSSNWYQGGSNYLSLLFNFNWDVNLNTVYHPNLMFNSALSYKLAVNANSKGALHKYSISQDQFQYNLKTGFKAWQKWFYSLTLQFKTQIFNAYPDDSSDLKAAFLSPADLNLGLGMTYNTKALKDRLKLSVSIAPISYNLKACLSDRIDRAQFQIEPGHKTVSNIGSNAEVNLEWNILSNVSWKSRLFLFTDYKHFTADWENTFNFTINKFLSTQLYLYPRFDSSVDRTASGWHYWMLKEILSVGFSYIFSTKP